MYIIRTFIWKLEILEHFKIEHLANFSNDIIIHFSNQVCPRKEMLIL